MQVQPSNTTRRQASLYLVDVPEVEAARQRFNPAQARLIPAHVTLCREDEVVDWTAFLEHARRLRPLEFSLDFGSPIREGNFVYLPVASSVDSFDQLRYELLARDSRAPRKQEPHITIIHPRNGVGTDEAFAEIARSIKPFRATFHAISFIEQNDGGVWRCLAEVALRKR